MRPIVDRAPRGAWLLVLRERAVSRGTHLAQRTATAVHPSRCSTSLSYS